MKGVRLVLYHLPELMKRGAETVYICEGEKDTEALESLGLLAACNPMGADKWRPEYSELIFGRSVVILPDNDSPGRKHAAMVTADLMRVESEVRIIEVPQGKDVSDWLNAGGTREELHALVISKRHSPLKLWRLSAPGGKLIQARSRRPRPTKRNPGRSLRRSVSPTMR